MNTRQKIALLLRHRGHRGSVHVPREVAVIYFWLAGAAIVVAPTHPVLAIAILIAWWLNPNNRKGFK